MRLTDIDAFRKDLGLAERCEECERDARDCQYDQIYTRMDFCGWLDDAEIIDAVPVVRCRDCRRRYDVSECPMCSLICGEYHEYTNENGFCDRGERRVDHAE